MYGDGYMGISIYNFEVLATGIDFNAIGKVDKENIIWVVTEPFRFTPNLGMTCILR